MHVRNLWIIGGAFVALTGFSFMSIHARNADAQYQAQADSDANGQNNWAMVWSDEFDGTALDPEKWTPETSCWGGGNNERQCYTGRPENVSVGEGLLKLTAKAEDFTAEKYPQDWADRGGDVTQSYTSGKVRTKGLAHWKYGRFEARIKLPHGQSTWPAFWMLPEDNHYGEWPLSGEIDIMEAINLGAVCDDCENSDTENRSSSALHYGQSWPDNKFQFKAHTLPNGTEAYHVYAVEWSESQMSWFVDDQKIFTMNADDWFTAAVDKADNKLAPFDQSFYLMLNLAVGGNLPDSKNEKAFNPSSFPSELHVDWVRVYQCKTDMETAEACLTQ